MTLPSGTLAPARVAASLQARAESSRSQVWGVASICAATSAAV